MSSCTKLCSLGCRHLDAVLVEELHFRKTGIATVQNHVDTPLLEAILTIVGRESDCIRLHRAVYP